MAAHPPSRSARSSNALARQLAEFRYQLRKFLRFSERAAHTCGVTPQQHQLLLGVAGFTGRGWATVSELAEFLQERHNAVVGLAKRAERAGLVHKAHAGSDQRYVRVTLTKKGARTLRKLTHLHRKELERFEGGFLSHAGIRPKTFQRHPEI